MLRMRLTLLFQNWEIPWETKLQTHLIDQGRYLLRHWLCPHRKYEHAYQIQTKRSLRHWRHAPPVPQNLSDFTLPDDWEYTVGSYPEIYFFYDNGSKANSRTIAFSSDVAPHCLVSATTIFFKGNVAMAPAQFSHVYAIRVSLRDVAVTCVFALL